MVDTQFVKSAAGLMGLTGLTIHFSPFVQNFTTYSIFLGVFILIKDFNEQ